MPETYFQVDARFGFEGPRGYIGRWFEGKEDRTAEREVAEAVAAAAGGAPALDREPSSAPSARPARRSSTT